MKRIICTVTTDLNYDQRMQRICTSLSRAGYEVLLVGREKRDSKSLVQQEFKQKRLRCWFQSGKWFYLEYNIRLFFFLLFKKADILNAIDLDTIMAVLWVGKLKSKKLVYDAHEYFTEVPEVIRRPKIKKVWEWVARKSIPGMDLCYTVGPALGTIFSERYDKPFGVVRNVPFKQEPPEVDKHPGKVIFYQGALNEGRGLEQMIAAMKELPQGYELWLAGEGDLSQLLRDQCREVGLEDRVKFLGFVLPSELKTITPKVWLGLNLLENMGQSYYYSLANKAFDYVQAEVPSLQMNFPEYEALQQQHPCYFLIPDLSKETLLNAVLKLEKDPELYKSAVNACKQAAQNWNWEKEELELIRLYDQLK